MECTKADASNDPSRWLRGCIDWRFFLFLYNKPGFGDSTSGCRGPYFAIGPRIRPGIPNGVLGPGQCVAVDNVPFADVDAVEAAPADVRGLGHQRRVGQRGERGQQRRGGGPDAGQERQCATAVFFLQGEFQTPAALMTDGGPRGPLYLFTGSALQQESISVKR